LKSADRKNLFLPLLLFAVSGVLLTVIQVPFRFSRLAWISYVPFILACSPNVRAGRIFTAGYIVSVVYWLANLYWMQPVTTAGWLAFCLYTALLWPLLAMGIRFCRQKKMPLFLAVAVLIVGAERLQGFFLGGFFWRFLAHSQYDNILLIQIADIFGAAGVSFLVAMVNALAAELIIEAGKKGIFKPANFLKTAVVFACIVAALVYGQWRIGQSKHFIEQGPLLAAVQSNVPQSVKESSQADERIFADLLAASRAAAKAETELIVWPETMVPAILDKAVLNYLSPVSPHRIFDEKLKQHSKDTAFVLVGATGAKPEIRENSTVDLLAHRYNSAFLYTPQGRQADVKYNKLHLVPFGEIVPFKKSAPPLHKLLMKFTPYDYDYSLDYGKEYTVFEITGDNGKIYRFAVMICYEDAVPAIGRRFALDKDGQKKVDWLINISNDGWFVKSDGRAVFPTTELAQHNTICVFRAVENRVAVLRSVNTGISCLIDSVGRIRDGYVSASEGFPASVMKRQAVAGWFADKVPIDKRVTFFSRHGQWLDFCCAFCFIVVLIWAGSQRYSRRKTTG